MEKRWFISGSILFVLIVTLLIFGAKGCQLTRIEQDELAFKYNVKSGRPVSPEDNPILPFGFVFVFGWHNRIFRVSSQSHQYEFTSISTPQSPYDEAASFDSVEGATMKVPYTILAHVEDVWKFYENYGKNQYDYPREYEGIKDRRIYEAIREAGRFVDVGIGEISQQMPSNQIRRSADEYKIKLTKSCRDYMRQFGLYIDDVLLSGKFEFPKGAAIERATQDLGDANSEVARAEKEKEMAENEKASKIAEAKKQADKILSEARKNASDLTEQASAQADALKESIRKIGAENTVELFMTERIAELIEAGVIEKTILDDNTFLATPFSIKAQN